MRRISVGNMALRERHVRSQLIRRLKVLIKEFPSFQAGEVASRFFKLAGEFFGSLFHRFAGEQGLARTGRRTGIGCRLGIGHPDADPGKRKARGLRHILAEYGMAALPDIGCRAVDHTAPVLYDQFCPAFVRQADTDAGVLHGTRYARVVPVLLIDILHRFQRLLERRGAIRDLAVRKHFARLDGIPVTDFPGGNADFPGQKVEQCLQGKLALAYAESPESARGRIVCIVSVASDVGILIAVRPHRMSAGALKHRTAQRRISARIKVDFTVKPGKNPVFVTAQSKGSLHGVAFRMERQGFIPGEFCLHRPLVFPGCQCGDVLYRHILLAAKAPADELVFHDDPLRIPAEHDGRLLACIISALVGAEYLDPVFIREGHRTFRFQESVLRKRCGK